jgi:lysophospholipase L1-like esterase
MFASLFLWAGCASMVVPTNTPLLPIRILPLGDSITQGGRADREEYTYRLPLQRMLHEAGVGYDFVGSLQAGLQEDANWPDVAPGVPFDPDHEGHYGWQTAAVRDELAGWLPQYASPDIALIHLGTNDQDASDYTIAIIHPLEEIIALLRARNPKVIVLVGHLNFRNATAQTIRAQIEDMAERLNTDASPVITVHHYRDWVAEPGAGSDTFDWAHPNPQGQEKMALAWFEAMKAYLPIK